MSDHDFIGAHYTCGQIGSSRRDNTGDANPRIKINDGQYVLYRQAAAAAGGGRDHLAPRELPKSHRLSTLDKWMRTAKAT